jgi:hypothetical protein
MVIKMNQQEELQLERFTKTGKSFKPKASIRQSGQIGLSVGAIQRFKLQGYEYAVLFYDSQHKVIGLKPLKEHEEGANRLRVREWGADVTAKAFLQFHQVPYNETKQYEAVWSDKYQMILIYLDKELDGE